MAVCDLCNEPGMGTLVNGDTFRAAIQKGFCPFRLGLDNDMGMTAIREEWRREALKSGTDWNLCNTCYTKFQPYAPKVTAAVGVTQTQSGGRSVAQLPAEHELAVAQAVLREEYVRPEVLADYGQLFQATKPLAAARVAALEIQLEAHETGRPASSYADYGKRQVQLDWATNIVKQISTRAEKGVELNSNNTRDEKKLLLKAEIDELNAEIEFRLQRLKFFVDGKWKPSRVGIGAKRIIFNQDAQAELNRLTRIHQSIIVQRACEQLRYVYAASANVSDRDQKGLSATLKLADSFRKGIEAAEGEGDPDRLKGAIDEAFKLTPKSAKAALFRLFIGSNYFNKSDCFIATATYGSPYAPEVSVFRRFRDEVLLSSIPGSLFVKVYYLVSPPWASLISKAPPLRNATRYLLLAPILSLLKMAERNKD